MLVISDYTVNQFDPWAGAVANWDELSYDEKCTVWESLEDLYPDGLTETEINDIIWFETDFIADILGFESWDQLYDCETDDYGNHIK
ncbi:MAG: hypothetical protein IKE94_01255 [Aeriscardovia sp.]|nr:hypothetical protein [Aeriscardovia sp.]